MYRRPELLLPGHGEDVYGTYKISAEYINTVKMRGIYKNGDDRKISKNKELEKEKYKH